MLHLRQLGLRRCSRVEAKARASLSDRRSRLGVWFSHIVIGKPLRNFARHALGRKTMVQFRDQMIAQSRFDDVDLESSEFYNVNLDKASVINASACDAAFTDVMMSNATFGHVCLTAATLRDVDLSASRLENVNLSNVDIRSAKIEGLRINGHLVSDLIALNERITDASKVTT
jgi:uncharacterized protein YjbI with pentapeptide repeats